jgi:hypothetical protein
LTQRDPSIGYEGCAALAVLLDRTNRRDVDRTKSDHVHRASRGQNAAVPKGRRESANRSQRKTVANFLSLRELHLPVSIIWTEIEPNFGSSRLKSQEGSRAGSRHGDELSASGIGQFRLSDQWNCRRTQSARTNPRFPSQPIVFKRITSNGFDSVLWNEPDSGTKPKFHHQKEPSAAVVRGRGDQAAAIGETEAETWKSWFVIHSWEKKLAGYRGLWETKSVTIRQPRRGIPRFHGHLHQSSTIRGDRVPR